MQGLIRVHASAPDGRTLTIRYCRPGSLTGILSLYAEPFLMPATTQALVDSELLGINPDLVRQLADRDVRVAKALLLELTERATVLRMNRAERLVGRAGRPSTGASHDGSAQRR